MIAAGDNSAILAAAMPFVHPWVAAAGAGLATVPLIIHLLNRRRFRRVVWAAMAFLLAANRRDARRLKIEQLLLLVVRTAIMVLIGMALARPLLRASPLADAIGRASVHRVILLDTSQSMAMPSGEGRTAFEHARALALSLLDSFNPTDGVSLITLAASAEAVFERPVHDRQLVRDELERLEVTQKGTDLLGGFSRAAAILEQSEAPIGSRVVYVLSDQARSAWVPAGAVESDSASGTFAAAKRVMELATVKLVTVEIVAPNKLVIVGPFSGEVFGGGDRGERSGPTLAGHRVTPLHPAIIVDAGHDSDSNATAGRAHAGT